MVEPGRVKVATVEAVEGRGPLTVGLSAGNTGGAAAGRRNE